MARTRKRQKPTVGFRAYLFVIARSGGNHWPAKGCKRQDREKVKKREKKCHFFWPDPLFFCQTTSFLTQNRPPRKRVICKLLPMRWLRTSKKRAFSRIYQKGDPRHVRIVVVGIDRRMQAMPALAGGCPIPPARSSRNWEMLAMDPFPFSRWGEEG